MSARNETAATLLRPVILLMIMVIAFTERLYSVLSYESIIHEVRTKRIRRPCRIILKIACC
jgi:hypothetical protein